jgi:hypothetical protein
MDVGVEGSNNRVAGRDYQDARKHNLTMVQAGHISLGCPHANPQDEQANRPLVPAQRNALYELGLKCSELGADSKEIWRKVFAELGVTQIADITAGQFPQARSVLQRRLDQLQDEADKRRLTGKILRLADEKAARAEMNNYCELTFGRTQLATLQRPQLQRVLDHLQRLQPQSHTNRPQAAPAGKGSTLEMLLTRYPLYLWGMFAAGMLVGKIIF